MAKARKTKNSGGGRGSVEAIEKRRAARQLNALLTGGSKKPRLDGRTEKRRQRLIEELKDGKSGKELKPIDFLQHIEDLLEIGETPGTLKKQGVRARKTDLNDEVLETVAHTQEAYGFRPEAWKMMGIDIESMTAASEPAKKTTRKPSKSTKGSRRRKARK